MKFKSKLDEEWYFKFKRPAIGAVCVVLDSKKRLLLIKRSDTQEIEPGKLAFPGGHLICDKETLEECAVRELQEETGLNVKKHQLKLLCVNSNPDTVNEYHTIGIFYLVSLNEDAPKIKAGDDAKEVMWVPLDEAYLLNFAFNHYSIVYSLHKEHCTNV